MDTPAEKHPDLTEDIELILVDGDILLYEFGFGAEYKDDEGNKQVRDFDHVEESIELWYSYIKTRLGCDNVQTYLTGKGNFREKLAVSHPYKDKRGPKPFHYEAIKAWLTLHYDAHTVEGMEADDYMAYKQTECLKHNVASVIASRDKDLQMVEGWHYVWQCGRQPEKLSKATKLGTLSLPKGNRKKLSGDGLKWFYAQCMMGDKVDTIPALAGVGPALAYDTLVDCETEEEMFSAVRTAYHERGYDDAYLLEQARLLWMCTEMDEQGNPVMWKPPLELDV